jgi:multidrug efflux pump subunit AcrA (membrane-fusion protein)
LYRIIFFFLIFSFPLIFCGDELYRGKIQKIESQLRQLEQEKKRYEKKAEFHRAQGEAFQFQKGFFLERRREYALAEKNLDKVRALEVEMDRLQKEKEEFKRISFE